MAERRSLQNVLRGSFAGVLGFGALAATLFGCGGGGGGGGSAPPPTGNTPPPPPPPPPPVSTVPPQSPTAIDLDDNHQVGNDHWPDGPTATGGNGANTAGLDCLAAPVETYHVHTHLSIFLNGEALAVPSHIGIVAPNGQQCIYAIHTHDKSGKIHVEAAASGTFTLGMFFQLWGQSLTDTNVAELTGNPIAVYSTDDGTVTQVEGNWADIELASHREITIVVGTPITEIPNFTWSAH